MAEVRRVIPAPPPGWHTLILEDLKTSLEVKAEAPKKEVKCYTCGKEDISKGCSSGHTFCRDCDLRMTNLGIDDDRCPCEYIPHPCLPAKINKWMEDMEKGK